MPGYKYTPKYDTFIPIKPGIIPDGVPSSRSENDPELRRALPVAGTNYHRHSSRSSETRSPCGRHQLPSAQLVVVGDGAVPCERDGDSWLCRGPNSNTVMSAACRCRCSFTAPCFPEAAASMLPAQNNLLHRMRRFGWHQMIRFGLGLYWLVLGF